MKTKRSIMIIISMICLHAVSAQSNLAVNQIIVYDIPASGTQAITVPAGKIWELESVSMGSSGTAPAVFLKNSSSQNIAFFSSPASTGSAAYPFWFPPAFTGTFVNNNSSYRCSISIIEFNVAP